MDLFYHIENPNDGTVKAPRNPTSQIHIDTVLDLVKRISSGLPQSNASNHHIFTSLLDAMMKCGDVTSAESLFNTLTKKSLALFGAMMTGISDSFIFYGSRFDCSTQDM